MKIVLVSDWFAEKMGYNENCFPKALASLGHEVHLITSNVQPYFNCSFYRETYEPFIGPGIVPCGTKTLDGYTLYRLPHKLFMGKPQIRGLWSLLRSIRPEIVQVFEPCCLPNYAALLAQPFLKYRLFLESHIHASVFPVAARDAQLRDRLPWIVYSYTWGRIVNTLSDMCYPISSDAADIVTRIMGIPIKKISICSLGVDTELFRPVSDEATMQKRVETRKRLGFSDTDIVCVYTGRFTEDKGPVCLAQAIGSLTSAGLKYRGLFVGHGTECVVKAIANTPGCVIHPLVPAQDLPAYYWASDIGVWPKQESTSQLDAAACGLPIIVSNRVSVRERVEGNGLFYEEGNHLDLARQIASLDDPTVRKRLGECGSEKMRGEFSWIRIAKERVRDYEVALSRK